MKTLTIILILSLLFPLTASAACRSRHVKHEFDVLNGFPNGRQGYIVDHVCALANGGLDIVDNMQYQTIEEAKRKDRIENTPKGRAIFCTSSNSLPYRTVFNCR